jgi:peptidoglycan/LPS O-acetylase OafA/YrhL
LDLVAPVHALSWWKSALAVLFYFGNFLFPNLGMLGHTWPLSIEEQYYFVWPIILILFLGFGKRRLLLSFILVAVGGNVLLRAWLQYHHFTSFSLYTFTPVRTDGILLALTADAPWLKRIVPICYAWWIPGLLLAGFAILMMRTIALDPSLYFGCFTLIAAGFWLLLLCVSSGEPRHYLIRGFDAPPARWIGRRFYGLYLYHVPIFMVLESLPLHKSVTNFAVV